MQLKETDAMPASNTTLAKKKTQTMQKMFQEKPDDVYMQQCPLDI